MAKKDRSILTQRDNDLLRAFYNTYTACDEISTLPVLVSKVINNKADRFYISARTAYLGVKDIQNKNACKKMFPLRKEMYIEIDRRLKSRLATNKSLKIDTPPMHILEEIIEEPAPSFYLTTKSAIVILSKIRKRRRCGRK